MLWVLLFWVMINIGFNKQSHSQEANSIRTELIRASSPSFTPNVSYGVHV